MKPVKTTKTTKPVKTKAEIAKDKAFADALYLLEVADHLEENGEEDMAQELRAKYESLASFIVNGK